MIPEVLLDFITAVLGQPLLLGVLLALATFVTEDGTLILGSQLLGTGQAGADVIVTALVLGILVGDIGLYGLGYGARRNKAIRRFIPLKAARGFKRWITGRETLVLFASRFMPGTRLPTYVTFGFLKLSLVRFSIVMAVAAIVWVGGTLFFIKEIQTKLMLFDTKIGLIGGLLLAILLIIVVPSLLKRSRKLAQYRPESVAGLSDSKEDHQE